MKRLPRKHCTLIGYTESNIPVFFGKKETDNPHARDLSLWYTIGSPRVDASNYHRVPEESEQAWISGRYNDRFTWYAHLRVVLNLTINPV
jgi:hypothetical protein